MPHGPVRTAGEHPCERGVCSAALLVRRRLMHRRPHQRVPEPEPAALEGSEARCCRPRPVAEVDARAEELFCGAAQLGDLCVLERREQQQCRYIVFQSVQPGRERCFEPSRERQRLPDQSRLETCRDGGELDQGQGVARGLCQDPLLQVRGQAGAVDVKERARRGVVQTRQVKLGKVAPIEVARHAVADRKEQEHHLHVEAPRDELQHLGRGPVEPMRVIDHDQQWPRRRALGEHAEGCQADQEDVRRIALDDAEGDVQRSALRIRKLTQAVEEWQQELMKRSKGQPRLRLGPRRRHHGRTLLVRTLRRRLQERRLADAHLSTHHQGAAVSPDPIDHPVELFQLRRAPHQGSPGARFDRPTRSGSTHPQPPLDPWFAPGTRHPLTGILQPPEPKQGIEHLKTRCDLPGLSAPNSVT